MQFLNAITKWLTGYLTSDKRIFHFFLRGYAQKHRNYYIAGMLPENPNDDILYQLALTYISGIGAKTGRVLLERFGNARDAFKAPLKDLKLIEGIGEVRAKAFRDPEVMTAAEKELAFVRKNGIQTFFITDPQYPKRLATCSDSPLLLFYKGNANLDATRVVAIVGTRKNTDYGMRITEELVDGLRSIENILIVSGLALGIDAIAHKRCVLQGIATVGVMGHGLDRIYPANHKDLARQMVANGGVLTEFSHGSNPDPSNFPMRNRIVAGMSDVTVVVESSKKGGALITAHMASSYNRDVLAYPGRINDTRSAGCNDLIRTNIAGMITKPEELPELMNWIDKTKKKPIQKQLFINFSADEEKIVNVLQTKDQVHADELYHQTGLPNSMLAATLLQLEMQGIIKTLPGKYYRMN